MRHFPLFIDLDGAAVILVGQGGHARKKLEKLLPYRPRIYLFSSTDFEDLADHPQITLHRRPLTAQDLDPAPAMVIVTDTVPAEKERISELCRRLRIPVNVEDVPQLCSFYFPALITNGALSIGICTSGQGPAAATLLREQFEAKIPDQMEAILDWSGALRQRLAQTVPEFSTRRRLLRQLMAEAMAMNRPLTEEETTEICKHAK